MYYVMKKIIDKYIRQILTNPIAVSLVRFFNLGNLMKRFYYRLKVKKDKNKIISFYGIKSKFYVNNFETLREIETATEGGYRDEKYMLIPILKTLDRGDIAYDIGANIGIYTIFMATKVDSCGLIIAIEPEINNFEKLKKNININNLNNVMPIKIALGDKIEEGDLYIDRKIGIGSISLIKSDSNVFCQFIKIIPGDLLLKRKCIYTPKAVKIDVEGYEYEVLKGLKYTLSQEKCKLICCEIHPKLLPSDVNSEKVLGLIRSYGFTHIESYDRGSEIHAISYKH